MNRQCFGLLSAIVLTLTNHRTSGDFVTTSMIPESFEFSPNTSSLQETNVTEVLQRGLFDDARDNDESPLNDNTTRNDINKELSNETRIDNSIEQRGLFRDENNSTRNVERIDDSTNIDAKQIFPPENEESAGSGSLTSFQVAPASLSSLSETSMENKDEDENFRRSHVNERIEKNKIEDNGTRDNWSMPSLKKQIFNDERAAPSTRLLKRQSEVEVGSKNITGTDEFSSDRPLLLGDNEGKRDNEGVAVFHTMKSEDEESLKNVESRVKTIIGRLNKLPINRQGALTRKFNSFLNRIITMTEENYSDRKNDTDILDFLSKRRCCRQSCCCKRKSRKKDESSRVSTKNVANDTRIIKNERRTIPESEENEFSRLETTTVAPPTAPPSSTEAAMTTTMTTAPPLRLDKTLRTTRRRKRRRKRPIVLSKMARKGVLPKKKCNRRKKKGKESTLDSELEKFDEEEQDRPNYRRNFGDLDDELGTFTEAGLKDYEFVETITEDSSRY